LTLTCLLVAPLCYGADAPIPAGSTIRGTIDGKKVTYPPKTIAEGVKVTVGMLESCHTADQDAKLYTSADLKKALKKDHLRLVFSRPTKVKVLGNTIEVSELVFGGGVFWVRSGNKVWRCTKYEFGPSQRFEKWRERAPSSR
jgi:hypothetical protein